MKSIKRLLPKSFKDSLKIQIRKKKVLGKQKIFGIGLNKTGTTSLKIAMNDLGYVVGNQRMAEALIDDWAVRDFNKLIQYCHTGQFFQDSPFSIPFTFIPIHQAFPDSKFILTIRDNPEQWYNSITKFHAKKWGKNGRIPTKEDLMNATYLEKGRPWKSNRYVFETPEDDPYEKDTLIEYYNRHNASVIDYFRHRPGQLLVLNVSEEGAYQKLCNFIGKEALYDSFPWENKTKEIKS